MVVFILAVGWRLREPRRKICFNFVCLWCLYCNFTVKKKSPVFEFWFRVKSLHAAEGRRRRRAQKAQIRAGNSLLLFSAWWLNGSFWKCTMGINISCYVFLSEFKQKGLFSTTSFFFNPSVEMHTLWSCITVFSCCTFIRINKCVFQPSWAEVLHRTIIARFVPDLVSTRQHSFPCPTLQVARKYCKRTHLFSSEHIMPHYSHERQLIKIKIMGWNKAIIPSATLHCENQAKADSVKRLVWNADCAAYQENCLAVTIRSG